MFKPATSSLRKNSSSLEVLHRILDCTIVASSLPLACILLGTEPDLKYAALALLAAALFFVASGIPNLYRSWRLSSLDREAAALVGVLAVVAGALFSIGFLSKTSANFSRLIVVNWGLLAFALLMLERLFLRAALRLMRNSGSNTRSLAIVGTGQTAREIALQVKNAGWAGLNFCGHFANSGEDSGRSGDDFIELAGSTSDLVALAREGRLDYVYIALPARAETEIMRLIGDLADTTASVYVVPDLFLFRLAHARWINFDGTPIVSVYESPFDGMNAWLKRAEDLVLSALILGVVLVPMILIALAIKLTSSGPVLFKQRRYGLNGKVVWIWKFRTMTANEDGDTVTQAKRDDARVTRLGTFLRRTSLDELPQFLNVLSGQMSVVGPRPHAVAHNEQYRKLIPGYMLRHKVKPGITGLAQINGWRGETDTLYKMQRRVECDLEYMRNWSIWLDLKIVLISVAKGFVNKNAF